MKIFGVTGWKNTGKTTLTEKLVQEITRRGYDVATIKHAHHAFDIDHPGRDSHRHRMAGARQVLVSSGARWALMTELSGASEPSLSEQLARLAPCDLVLIEGYKREGHPKIETWRAESGRVLRAPEDPQIVAVASDSPVDVSLPCFDLNAAAQIADFILDHVGLAHCSQEDGA